MISSRAYLDHNATSPLRPEARAAMIAAMDVVGNPSSIHAEGRAARAIVETARERIAHLMDVRSKDIVFTSGGTEAANAAIYAAAKTLGRNGGFAPILVAATEHSCVLNAARRLGTAEILPVNERGLIDSDAVLRRLKELGPAVIAVQEANSETGIQHPSLNDDMLYENSGSLRINDMVQTAGRAEKSHIYGHMAFISAHKFGGPKGAGAIAWIGRGLGDAPLQPLLHGGGQERGRRAGTENVIGIAGMAAALEAGDAQSSAFWTWASKAQDELEAGIRRIAPDAVIFGECGPRVPHTTCFSLPGLRAETALIAFDLDGVSVSSGSACSSGKVERSHVLKAMGVADDLCDGAIRVSTGWTTQDSDIERFLTVLSKICKHRRVARAA